MKIILRILTLPFAMILWIIHYGYYWVRHGGEIVIKNKPTISPEEFHRLLTEVADRLADFEAQKDEALHWKRLYENYDLDHCALFEQQLEDSIDFADWIAKYGYKKDQNTDIWQYWDNGIGRYSTKELFELFKKEKYSTITQ